MEISRRFFLGGAVSLVAAQTFIPSVLAMMNLPTIYGDGRNDDTCGLGALFRNEPVTFNKEKIGVDSHGGIKFHSGIFRVTQTIHMPKDVKIEIDQARFLGDQLDNCPFFDCEDRETGWQFNYKAIFEVGAKHNSKLIIYPNDKENFKISKGISTFKTIKYGNVTVHK